MRPSKSLIYGRHPVLEALQQQVALDRIFMQQTAHGENIGDIVRLAKEQRVPIMRVPAEKLNTLVKGNHQGIVAMGAVVRFTPLQDVISHAYEQGQAPWFILLDGITDVRNTGAIIRTAVCMGADAILFAEKHAAPLHEDMVKTSAGAMMKLTFCREKSLPYIVETLQLNGIRLVSSEMRAQTSLWEVDFKGPLCVVMGSEDKGISSVSRQACDQLFKIPMAGEFDSLNVSVATGIICAEAMKQRFGY